MEAVTDTNFVDLYGSVVWAKSQPYPWWPCYIFDPEDFCKKENLGPSIKKRARASVSKNEYIVYFYGDEEQFGFVSPQNIKEFTTQFNLPTIHPCYYETHKKGIELASNECTLPKEKRVAWSRKHAMIEYNLLNPEEEIEIKKVRIIKRLFYIQKKIKIRIFAVSEMPFPMDKPFRCRRSTGIRLKLCYT